MKRIVILLILSFSHFLIFSQTLTLVHTSDTHSCVEPISPNDIKPEQADKGGFIRRVRLKADYFRELERGAEA